MPQTTEFVIATPVLASLDIKRSVESFFLLVRASLVLAPDGWRIAQQGMQREFEFPE